MAAVHAEVLAGRAPDLANYYPSCGGTYERKGAWQAFRSLLSTAATKLRPRLDQQVQTNEVRRSAVLLGGFSQIAQRTGLPLRLFELGSSAGLNLHWDQFHFDLGSQQWGLEDTGVKLLSEWRGQVPTLQPDIPISGRAGCDRFPIDVRKAAPRGRLRSFIWPDQLERLAILDAAIAIMRADPIELEADSAADFLEGFIEQATPGETRVLYHSVVW